MSVVIKDACTFIGAENFSFEDVELDFSKRGSTMMYIRNVTDNLLYDITYKTNHPNMKIVGPKALPSWHKTLLKISWEPCEGDDFFLDVTSKVR